MLITYLLVALGGSLGAITRFVANNIVSVQTPDKPYLSTLMVNVVGSLLLGFFYYASSFIDFKSNLRDFFIIGYLGSLTTFSTFSFEFAKMIIDKDFSRAFGYLSFNILLGFLSVYLFLKLIKI
ncbi:MAG: CrcB family protein [bacterium]|jgi:CrcB protein|tara:strand:- start:8588 stop:8959 length:372 start_codon:yes stop_codon:yes gene_type:complete